MKKLLFLILGTTSIFFGTSSLSAAANFTETEFSLMFNTPPSVYDDEPIEVCGFVNICNSNVATIVPDVNPNIATPPQPYVNDAGFSITGIFAKIPENRPQGPGVFVGGISSIFSDINISEDKQELSFTGGVIPVNEIFFADFETEPEADSALFLTFTTTPESSSTPEPSSLVTILVLGFLGTGLCFQKRKNKSRARWFSPSKENYIAKTSFHENNF